MADFEKPPYLLKTFLKDFCTLVLGLVIIVSLLITYIISLPVFLFRYALTKAAKIFRPELGAIISAQGNMFSSDLFSSRAPRCSIVIPMVIEGSYSAEYFHKWILSDLVEAKDKVTGKFQYPEFKQYLEKWFGFAFWRNDPHFDIRNHVKMIFVRDEDDQAEDDSHPHQDNDNEEYPIVTEKDAATFIEQLINRQFHPRRSPWEMYLLNNYEDPSLPHEGPKTLVLLRVHHSLADGYSILYAFVEGLLRSSLTALQLPTPNYVKRGRWAELLFTLTIPLRILSDISQYAVKALRNNPWLIQDGKKSWKQYYGRGEPFPIEKIKEIKDELKVSFTSVLLAPISRSLARYYRAKERGDIERAAFFIPLPLPGHPNALRNHVTGAQIDLPLGNYSDPTMRVRECDRLINEQKRSTVPMLLLFLGRTLGLHISSICGLLTANQVNISGLTSFPAGSSTIKLGNSSDKKVLSIELVAGALTGVSGAAFTALSYGKQMRFGLAAESAVMNRGDVDKLLKLLSQELALLHDIVVSKKKPNIPIPSC